MSGACRRVRPPRTAWMDIIKTRTGLPVEESIRMTEDRDKWRKETDWMLKSDNQRRNVTIIWRPGANILKFAPKHF